MENSKKSKQMIEVSREIIGNKKLNYTADGLRLLQTYLSKINPRDIESGKVCFSKTEFENICGVDRIRVKELKKHTSQLCSIVIETDIDDGDEGGYIQKTLFVEAKCEKNESGVYMITMECNKSLTPLLFDLKSYISYPIDYVKNLTSKYSIRMYWYLKSILGGLDKVKKFVPLDELRKQMQVEKMKSFDMYKNIKGRILDIAEQDINGHTDIIFSYDTIKEGTKVIEIEFHINKAKYIEVSGEEKEDVKDIYTQAEKKDLMLLIAEYKKESCDNRSESDIFEDYRRKIELRMMSEDKEQIKSAYAYTKWLIETDMKAEVQKKNSFIKEVEKTEYFDEDAVIQMYSIARDICKEDNSISIYNLWYHYYLKMKTKLKGISVGSRERYEYIIEIMSGNNESGIKEESLYEYFKFLLNDDFDENIFLQFELKRKQSTIYISDERAKKIVKHNYELLKKQNNKAFDDDLVLELIERNNSTIEMLESTEV